MEQYDTIYLWLSELLGHDADGSLYIFWNTMILTENDPGRFVHMRAADLEAA